MSYDQAHADTLRELAAERAAREAATAAKERAEAECERLREGLMRSRMFAAWCAEPHDGATIRKLADLEYSRIDQLLASREDDGREG